MASDFSTGAAKKVDWEIAKICFAEIQREAPTILQQAVVIGGIACWFYRNLLSKANDPVFKVPTFSESDENLWLSKDIGFTNYFAEDARNLLPKHIVDQSGRRALQIAGVPIGFAQVGLTFDPESAWAQSWITTFDVAGEIIQCRILNPIALYREKLALTQRRASNSDQIHCAAVAEFLRYEVCKSAKSLDQSESLEQRTLLVNFLISVRDNAPEICQDTRVVDQLGKIVANTRSLALAERKLLNDLSSQH